MNFKIALLVSAAVSVSFMTVSNPALANNQDSAASGLTAFVETAATARDGANDPAIWVNAKSPADSLILGSGAAGGIEVYSLDGKRVSSMTDRPISLIDVRYKFKLKEQEVDLVAAFDTAAAEIVVYTIDVKHKTLRQISSGALETKEEIEGLCMYHSPLSGKFYVFVTGAGMLQQWELHEQSGELTGRQIRTLPLGLGAAHCTVNDRKSVLYYSQETVGVWIMNAEPESEGEARLIDTAAPLGRFEGDVKGLAIQQFADGSGYLLASDADASRLQIYDLLTHEHITTIVIGKSTSIDAVEETEGLAATSLPLSGPGSHGLVVLSDDSNDDRNTNYKLVSWDDIVAATALKSAPAYNPALVTKPSAVTVTASIETEPVSGYGDAADDPAIWVHPDTPELSLIIGTQKQRGINVYDMSGKLLQSLADGRMNNTDLRYGFRLAGKSVDILTASNRSNDSIAIYLIEPLKRELVNIADGVQDTGMVDPYGSCMFHSPHSGHYYVFVNDTDGVVKQWRLEARDNGRVGTSLVREFEVGSQTEGCVADDETGDLYVGEENIGIWKYSAEPDGGEKRSLVDSIENGNLTDDVEGLSIHYGAGGTELSGYLIASNQGADNYALYERSGDNHFIGLFHVVADELTGIDGSSETDGLDVSSANLGPGFPYGVLVVQDGRNISPLDRQNFKLIPWERVAKAFELPLQTGYDPRGLSNE